VTDDTLEDAWADLHAATPRGWYVGRPSYHDERDEWTMRRDPFLTTAGSRDCHE